MTRRLVSGAVAGLFAAAVTGGALAQTTGYVPGTAPAPAPTENSGYVRNAYPTPTDGIVKSGVYNSTKGLSGNLCYRTGYWTPAMATIQCDPDLVPKPKPPAPAPAAAPTPPPKPAPTPPKPAPAPQVQKITLASKALFDFDKYALKPEGKAKLDDLVSKMAGMNLEVIIAVGHTDNIGTMAYNQKLSERRANAVKEYLVSKGVEKNRVYTEGKSFTQPIASNKTAEGRAKNRRVEIEMVGTRSKQ